MIGDGFLWFYMYRNWIVIAHGINAADVKKLQDVGIYTCNGLMMHTKKVNNWNRFNCNSGGTLVEKCCHFLIDKGCFGANHMRVMASGGVDVNHKDEIYDGKIIKLQLPSFFNNFDPRVAAANFPSGVQAYLAGLTFALVASPCSTPVLATLLGYKAASKICLSLASFRFKSILLELS
ncbi:hypothetical protein LOK49_LG02G02898 [Camellia lanceoleosa]|uniref:Uncharacterized protein n=1 Tax=Camellia lanceoleosa TaxID=1840588 RepID=A0ACC0IM06_9ERIC|nr:hypothetical protein LOK49_LG02G02898 [Camellia lanceoleosa]